LDGNLIGVQAAGGDITSTDGRLFVKANRKRFGARKDGLQKLVELGAFLWLVTRLVADHS
jgi:hypothetical protein